MYEITEMVKNQIQTPKKSADNDQEERESGVTHRVTQAVGQSSPRSGPSRPHASPRPVLAKSSTLEFTRRSEITLTPGVLTRLVRPSLLGDDALCWW